ncbi:hypothetical protein [Streptomyces sp. NPDC056713]|uniref:hypothetical protein n=1 Tax=Streptomyces sp. NPDC056713 TaxID=3345921 RepID=UPI00367ED5A7
MTQSVSPTSTTSIKAPTRRALTAIGKKGPAFTAPCGQCDGFDTVVVRRGGGQVTYRCTCQLRTTA